ncbi:methyltransferase TYW3-domain-containing protein [Halenospora varia]|nr:methyltransferase TYW3-domain-containing protein [Halenospora varia]
MAEKPSCSAAEDAQNFAHDPSPSPYINHNTMTSNSTPLTQSFLAKKKRILQQLAVPDEDYDDLSPKGSVDLGIRDLIEEINALEGCVTTSSCAGRWKGGENGEGEGEGERENVATTTAGVGGKGGGGRWLFVSHDPVDMTKSALNCAEMLGMQRRDEAEMELSIRGSAREARFIHFKFEPMILHVLTASLHQAQTVLSAALQAGFRESGGLNLTSSTEQPTPMVGIRSMGLALESIIGFEHNGQEICTVPEWQLGNLLEISNDRFVENTKRIERFRALLKDLSGGAQEGRRKGQEGEKWEDPQSRRERKRAEGLRMKEASSKAAKNNDTSGMSEELLDGIELPE